MRVTLLLVFLFFALPAYAQTPLNNFFPALTIELSNDFPRPNSTVQAEVKSNTIDLTRSEIEWYVNNELLTEGGGRSQATISIGSEPELRIVVVVESPEGSTSEERIIRPASVDLLWEANTYTHPLYKGRRLASPGSTIEAEARPRILDKNGKQIPIKDIIFTWRKNEALIKNASGRGRYQATIPAPQLFGTDSISVEASSLDESSIARSTLEIPSTDPTLSLYRIDPLYGILFQNQLGNSVLIGDSEASFTAFPFFSASSPFDPLLKYEWKVNGVRVPAAVDEPNAITLNADSGGESARIELDLGHSTNFFLDARGVWNVIFNAVNTGPFNPFGAANQ